MLSNLRHAETVLHALAMHAQDLTTTFVNSADLSAPRDYSRGELLDLSGSAAGVLRESGVNSGDRVFFFLDTCVEVVAGVLGAWSIGAITSIQPTKWPRAHQKTYVSRLAEILTQATPRAVVVADELVASIEALLEEVGIPAAVIPESAFVESLRGRRASLDLGGVRGEQVAHLQFTSGTTGRPKGVPIRHKQIVSHSHFVLDDFDFDSDRFVFWLPLHHDFGFFGGLMAPLVLGSNSVQIAPVVFARSPVSWLRAMSMWKGTISGAPPSALNALARHLTNDVVNELDLSSWRVAWVAAEPLFHDRLEAFQSALRPCGFREDVLSPAYGMAEAVVGITVARGALRAMQIDGTSVVDCGKPFPGIELEIRGENGERIHDSVGEVHVRGETVADHYWGEVPREEPWLATGDLGLIKDGRLFVTGRKKDLIIRGGANIHPQWIENAIESLTSTDIGADVVRACAFARRESDLGRESVTVAIEVNGPTNDAAKNVVRRAVLEAVGIQIDAVHFCSPGSIPRTTSGKLQRSACSALFSGPSTQRAKSDS